MKPTEVQADPPDTTSPLNGTAFTGRRRPAEAFQGSKSQPADCMRPRMATNATQHKLINLLKRLQDFCVYVITCCNVFNVWPKTTFLLPVWPRDTIGLDTPARPPSEAKQGPIHSCRH